MPAPTLAQTQQLLWTLITATDGAAAGLDWLAPSARSVAASLVHGDGRLSAIDRIDVYANMYFYRIRDGLKDDFATVCAVIGEAEFHNLITDYLIAHPPTHFSLRYAGQHLPAFLDGHALSGRRPYLSDLARLEWAILDAFDATDATPLQPQTLTAVPQERWPELRFLLTPSLQLLDLNWAVHNVWRQAQERLPLTDPRGEATSLRVWRQDLRIFHQPIDAVERAGLAALAGGACFSDVCERIVAHAGEARGAERALSLLGGWLADGVLIGYRLD